ncbi:amidase domain-containing protein [Bacillus sp. FJAT-45037]|uniref:amidase domain-containing protein n=1 Tax=Bacillus sp. FJAT-45037 TaxID=2011007 RepID=UPI000C24D9E6|nr:amidase domain-containing protein [Bacillus sp. FJAT-45037]
MEKRIVQPIHELIHWRNERYVQLGKEIEEKERWEDEVELLCWLRARDSLLKRGAEVIRSYATGDIIRKQQIGRQELVDYVVKYEQFIKVKRNIYHTERIEERRAFFEDGNLVKDVERKPKRLIKEEDGQSAPLTLIDLGENRNLKSSYNRLEAVKYAERWWDEYNPAYKKFTDNCTNFISQCMRAGRAPMNGGGNRSKGWWFHKNNWSYSWTVAHSFRWYLSGAKAGLRGVERQSASDLALGDVICYDFNGDGRWQHCTIVVAKDGNGEPLVNAQSANSRMRYWKYEDSTAWTPNIKYKYFHIEV